jgi:hypothetical protein
MATFQPEGFRLKHLPLSTHKWNALPEEYRQLCRVKRYRTAMRSIYRQFSVAATVKYRILPSARGPPVVDPSHANRSDVAL